MYTKYFCFYPILSYLWVHYSDLVNHYICTEYCRIVGYLYIHSVSHPIRYIVVMRTYYVMYPLVI